MSEPNNKPVTEEILDLKLKALWSNVRLLVVASVALNQFLTNVELPTAVSVTAVGAMIVTPLVKAFLAVLGGR